MSNAIKSKVIGNHTFQDTLHLEPINGVNFTKREIDVIACILSGKSVKKIALFLTISPKTVENHVHNIMLKLGCQSQESIIEFIEKSDKFLLIRKHYLDLLIRSSFLLELKATSKLMANYNYACLFIMSRELDDNTILIARFINDLELVGFKVFTEHDGKNDFDKTQAHELEFTHIIYISTPILLDKLDTLQIDNLTKIGKNLRAPVLFVIIDPQNSKEFLIKSFPAKYLRIGDQDNYYFFVFEALKQLLPNHNIDKNIIDFKNKYNAFHDATNFKSSSKKDTDLLKIVSVKTTPPFNI
jgi:DNA-binding CsgD family transcriptional regulator